MGLKKEDIERLAELARLELTEAEKAGYAEELTSVLGYVDQLKTVDTKGVSVTHMPTELKNITRPDEVSRPKTFKKKLLGNAPVSDGDSLVVRAVFEE